MLENTRETELSQSNSGTTRACASKSGDEQTFEIILVPPCGEHTPSDTRYAFHRSLVAFTHVDDYPPERSQVLGRMILTRPALIFFHSYVQHVMQVVLNAPMLPDRPSNSLRVTGQACYIISSIRQTSLA